MTPDEIEQMKADIEAGTPGPWRAGQQGNFRVYGPDGIGEHSGLIAEVLKGRANARRIARVPQLEAEVMRLRRVIFEAQQLGEAGMLDEMLATIDADTHELQHRND